MSYLPTSAYRSMGKPSLKTSFARSSLIHKKSKTDAVRSPGSISPSEPLNAGTVGLTLTDKENNQEKDDGGALRR